MADGAYGPWNPGLSSHVPTGILKLSTMFRAENVSNTFREVHELADFTGLSPFDLVAFRPERLVAHEILIRVTADLTVPDGPNYEDLGISLRSMVATILDRHLAPELPALVEAFEGLSADVSARVRRELDIALNPPTPKNGAEQRVKTAGWFGRILHRREAPKLNAPRATDQPQTLLSTLDDWTRRAGETADPVERAGLNALFKVVSTIVSTRGRLIADIDTVVKLATILACNAHGGEFLGREIEPLFAEACARENYRVLPPQSEPVIMNVKGASAAGKSTIRSLQCELAGRLGVPWKDFALISPDYWRKFLLDYDSLGEHYKYAGTLTGHELAIIDKKLDRYMAQKAADGRMSHLLIDRFRFDSFAPQEGHAAVSNLLTRFGETIYLFFMITPPDATVERAWLRGLATGRYKPVDDLLFHNIEAYTGIPPLFFSWAASIQKRVHYEFLDNSVSKGERPRSIASGWNRRMEIYDLAGMLDIERFKRVNTRATSPEQVYADDTDEMAENLGFLRQCIDLLDDIRFVDPASGETYARVENGQWTVWTGEPELSATRVHQGLALLGLTPPATAGVEAPKSHEQGAESDNVPDCRVGRLQ